MKTMKFMAVFACLALILSAMAFANTDRMGESTISFNRAKYLAKSAAYTVTTSDNGAEVGVTCSSANLAITLPSWSSATAGGTFRVKIKKVDSTVYTVTATPATGDTIGGESTRKLLSQNAYMVLHTGSNNNWTVEYESPYLIEDHAAGTYTTGIGSGGLFSAPTVSTVLTTSDCGNTIAVATDSLTFTLPAATANCKFMFINKGAAGANILDIKASSTDAFAGTLWNPGTGLGTIVTSSTGSTLSNTKSTAKQGDSVELISTASVTWIISNNTGTWTTK